jgi:dienelactone hydrolase
MRSFEALLLLTAAIWVVRAGPLHDAPWPSWSLTMPAVLAALLVLHLLLEGWRSQMLAAYAIIVALVALAVAAAVLPSLALPLLAERAGLAVRWLVGSTAMLLLGATAGLCVLRPVVRTPPPAGPFAVGTVWVAPDQTGGASSPGVRLWYPAQPQRGARTAPYLTETRIANRRVAMGITRAMIDAPPVMAPGRLPVLLYFPGWGGTPSQGTILLHDLASHGYVVAGVDAWDPAAYPADPSAAADLATPLMFDSDAAAALAMQAGERNATRQAGLAVRVLDRLAALDRTDPDGRFAGRLDLDHTGIFGFSFGGVVALEAAAVEPRLRAVANLDGGGFTDIYIRGFTQPYLLLSEPPVTPAVLNSPDLAVRREAIPDLEDEVRLAAFMTRRGGMRGIIADMGHINFQDAPLLNPWRRLGGAIDPRRARVIVNAFLLAFFDHTLRAAPSPMPAGLPGAYPEVTLQVWTPPAAPSDTTSSLTALTIPDERHGQKVLSQ